ncbi:MAG: molybdopterin-guanine dinucleotide biosynthesis protein B [Acidilobaceae archaeon]|nr:molybdopterin-guanine dinucleotide biosynthesis protein B [Acidilobaceae archaeon]
MVQVIGHKDSGKTSSIVLASRALKARGLKVAVLKHTHHDLDTPHKDSWRFIEEGMADVVAVLKGEGERAALFASNVSLEGVLGLLRADVILVEGFKELPLGLRVYPAGRPAEEVAEEIVQKALGCAAAGRGEDH